MERNRLKTKKEKKLPHKELYKEQIEIADSPAKYKVVCLGRRTGKTYLGVELAIRVLEAGYPVAWLAPNYKYLREPFDELRMLLADHIESCNQSEKRILLKNGARIDFWTLESPDPCRGFKYKLAIFDEAAMVKDLKSVWEKSVGPALTDYQGDAIWLSTPRGRGGDFYEFFLHGEDAGTKFAEWESFQLPTVTNRMISGLDEYVEKQRLLISPEAFSQEYEAKFVKKAGAVFPCFGEGNICDDFEIPEDAELLLGLDFGTANTASVCIFKLGKKYFVCMSYHGSGEDARTHVNKIRGRIPRKESNAYGGASSEDSIREEYKRAGMLVHRPKVTGPGSLEVGISILYKLFKNKELIIFRSLKRLINEIETYAYAIDTDDSVLDKIEDKESYHRLDALRYIASTLTTATELRKIGGRFDEWNQKRKGEHW